MSGRVKYLFISLRNWRGSELKHSSRLNLACCLEYLHHVIYSFRERTQKARSFPGFSNQVWKPSQFQDLVLSRLGGPWSLHSSSTLCSCPAQPCPTPISQAQPWEGQEFAQSFTNQVVASVSTPHLSLPLSYLKYYSIFFPVESAHLFRKGIF